MNIKRKIHFNSLTSVISSNNRPNNKFGTGVNLDLSGNPSVTLIIAPCKSEYPQIVP